MAYAIYYPSGCEDDLADHYCDDCPVPDNGRVSSVAFIANDFEFTDPSNPVEWATGIGLKKIIIIPKTNGTFDGGSEIEVPGYGRQASKLTGYNFVAVYNDPNYKTNATFYNGLKRSSNYKFAYVTGSSVHLTVPTVSAVPKNPVVDDVTSEIVWNVSVKWGDEDLPVPYDIPAGIFDCFQYTGAVV